MLAFRHPRAIVYSSDNLVFIVLRRDLNFLLNHLDLNVEISEIVVRCDPLGSVIDVHKEQGGGNGPGTETRCWRRAYYSLI